MTDIARKFVTDFEPGLIVAIDHNLNAPDVVLHILDENGDEILDYWADFYPNTIWLELYDPGAYGPLKAMVFA